MKYKHDNLQHSGIKGQKWGVRRFQNEDGTLTEAGKQRYGYYERADGTKDYARIQKDASNDANEYARAKAYYGEGAGNRRKIIRNRISERMKDPDYKAAFDKHMKEQNMEQHQKAADRERKWEDTKNTVGKTARGIKNILLGVGSASIAAIGIVKLAQATGLDKKIADWGKTAIKKISDRIERTTYRDIPMNERYSNPDIDHYQMHVDRKTEKIFFTSDKYPSPGSRR